MLPRSEFFRYLQMRNFHTTHKEFERVKNPSPIELFFKEIQTGHVKKIGHVVK